MAKPKALRVPSDDCTVKVDGVDYALHEGEWVEIHPFRSVGELQALEGYIKMQVEFDSVKGDADEGPKVVSILNAHNADILKFLAKRIVKWNWTDLRGEALPQPDGTAAGLAHLSNEELSWLVSAGQGETPSAAKNA